VDNGDGPHGSHLLNRGALGVVASVDSPEGRFLKAFEGQVLASLRNVTPVQRFLIANLAQTAFQLRMLERELLPPKKPTVDLLRIYSRLHDVFLGTYRELLGKPARQTPDFLDPAAALASLRQVALDGPSVDGDRYPVHVDADPPADMSEVPPPHGDAAPVDGRASRGVEPP
jgi:hypothetical protein